MFFRNVTAMRFPLTLAVSALDEGLAACALRPVGPMELSTRGFVSPYGRPDADLSNRVGTAIWVAVGGEDRILPGAVVNDLLQKKLDAIEKSEGRRPGGRARKRLKDELINDLLPRALIKPSRVDAILDLGLGVLFVDTSSRKVAESVASELRRALGSFPALPLNAEIATRSVLTGWVAGEVLPEGLSLGDECELRDALDQGAVVKCQRMELDDNAEIDKHLKSGKQATRLALSLDDHVTFVLGEDLVVRKLKLLEGATESLANTEREDLAAELDARFALMSHELRRLFTVLEPALRLSKVEG